MKTLVVFDFDHTMVDDNSDTWVIRCLPGQKLPESLKKSYRKGHWTEYMGRVMDYIGDQDVSVESIRAEMERIPLTAGMSELLTFISRNKSDIDCVVISDANSLFIDWILCGAGLRSAVDQVFTNPAGVNARGRVEVQHHHVHNCRRCPINMCKKKVLEDYLAQRNRYSHVFYVGDGANDLCPVTCLRGCDVVMPREGYALEELLEDKRETLKARIVTWSSGTQVLQELQASLRTKTDIILD
ncbi:pyridoxal phosphate phosphatase PHOSPHO2 [Corythoichthys intestinalis]|uniref:pyridoxal phosphate phosphatase PHOSPHO2 n=1 Tax=Corythoichthys intestinalis TaxID=161448 RepID=UPI0025A58B06|nr:pyridoxal phosphate phosphatase PHOSPHO2 [Corythoichthys intestinalis]XP_061795933.1 probable phosphatase phospho2 [Nerophis lumbriciformis]